MKSGDRVDGVGGLGLLDAQLAVALGRDVRVVGDHVHAERRGRARPRAGRSGRSRGSRASSRTARSPENLERSHLPAGQRGVGLGDVARERQQQRHRVLGGGDHVGLRRVGDDDPALGGGVHVDVVDARRRPGRPRAAGRPRRAAPRRAWSPSGSGSRRTRRSARPAPRATSRSRASTSKCSRSSSMPESPIFSATSTRGRVPSGWVPSPPARWRSQPALQHPVDAGGQRPHVGRVGGGEHRDPQLVAPELAVRLDVDDPVGAQRRRQIRGVDLVVEVDRARRPASAWPDRPRTASRARAAPPIRTGGCEDSVVRATIASRPPRSSIHSSWSASSSSVAIAGVL